MLENRKSVAPNPITDGQPHKSTYMLNTQYVQYVHAICAFHMCICIWACLEAFPLNKSAFLLVSGPLSSVTWKKLVHTLSTIILLALHNHLRLPIKLFLSTWIYSSTVPHTVVLQALSSFPFLGPEPAPILYVYTAQGSSKWDKHILFSKTPSCFDPKNVLKHFH